MDLALVMQELFMDLIGMTDGSEEDDKMEKVMMLIGEVMEGMYEEFSYY